MSLSDNKDTLRGYDIVLSISAEAINAQFKTLYEKTLPPDVLPPPAHLAGEAAPLPRPKHYISHDFQVFPEAAKDDEEEEDEEPEEISEKDRQGINAHIEAPRIAFHPEKQGIFTKSGKRKTKVLNLNGWEFSWHANIAQRDIDDVVSDLIDPAENSESQIQLPDDVIKQFKDRLNTDGKPSGVDSSTFTASFIFCVIESVQMTESFEIKPPPGVAEPTVDEQSRLITSITRHFKGMRDVAEQGKMNLIFPHKIPDLESINANADPKKTPPYFLPASVDSTTTGSPGNGFTEGTLNFCMLTNRRSNESRFIPKEDRDAGQFSETFFNKLRIYGGAGSSERPGGHDGVMAFSKQVFNDFWLNEYVVSRLVAKPEEYGYTLRMHGNTEPVGMKRYEKSTGLHDALHQLSYEYEDISCPSEPVYEQKRTAYGSNTVDARYTSDFMKLNDEERAQTDFTRNLYIDIDVSNELKLTHWTKGVNSIFSGGIDFWNSVDRWMEARTAEMRSKFKVGYDLSPGLGGVWSIRRATDNRYTFPGSDTEPEVFGPLTDDGEIPWEWSNWSGDSCQILLRNHNTFKAFGQQAEDEAFKGCTQAWYDFHDDDLQEAIESIMDELKSAVIMPAGNALTFSGLDCDEDGHVYSHIDYMTLSEIETV